MSDDKIILTPDFFVRPTPQVAKELLGCQLVRTLPDQVISQIITEVEVYDGQKDQASHARNGITERTKIMFGPPGHIYVYLCYGIHWLLNISTRESGYPAAILIRGTQEACGPGRLTKSLKIDHSLNGLFLQPQNGLHIQKPSSWQQPDYQATPRIGINYACEPWLTKPWRYVMIQA